jgi:putative addiction module component (TIGR02574 family)
MNTKPDCHADLERVQAEALKLSVADRERLLETLLASLDGPFEGDDPVRSFATPELEQYWIEECHRRMTLIESGEMETYPAEEVIARLRDRLRR